MNRAQMLSLAVLTFAISAVASFSIPTILAGNETSGHEPERAQVALTVAEAEEEAGFDLAAFSSIPTGYVNAAITIGPPKTPSKSRSVTQRWGDPKSYGMIILHQEATLDGLIEGQPADIRGRTGEVARYPQLPGRPYSTVAYFWRENGMGYTVVGAITGEVTEETIKRMVESVETS